MFITLNWISGIMLGIEYSQQEQAIIIDLLFFRIVLEW